MRVCLSSFGAVMRSLKGRLLCNCFEGQKRIIMRGIRMINRFFIGDWGLCSSCSGYRDGGVVVDVVVELTWRR